MATPLASLSDRRARALALDRRACGNRLDVTGASDQTVAPVEDLSWSRLPTFEPTSIWSLRVSEPEGVSIVETS